MASKQQFLFPPIPYSGDGSPQHIVFNANLQEFSQRVGLICALESGGHISPMAAFHQVRCLWQELKASKTALLDNPEWISAIELPDT